MRTFILVAAVVGAMTGCRHAAETYVAEPIRVHTPAADDGKSCIDRLLQKSRYTGYVEQTVDKDAGFFRVVAHETEWRLIGKSRLPKIPKGMTYAVVDFYNVQCVEPEVAIITPMNSRGPLGANAAMSQRQYFELRQYAQNVGEVLE